MSPFNMGATSYPEVDEIRALFRQEVHKTGGWLRKETRSGDHLFFMRAMLDLNDYVAPLDLVSAGVALCASGENVEVHPYAVRLVCANGSIHTENLASHIVPLGCNEWEAPEISERIREAIHTCCLRCVFELNIQDMRAMRTLAADAVLQNPEFRTEIGGQHIFGRVLDRLRHSGESTLFELMNAITSEARDEPDARRQWHLERVGGGILTFIESLPGREKEHSHEPPSDGLVVVRLNSDMPGTDETHLRV